MGQQKHVKCAGCGETAFLGRKDWREELKEMKWTVRGSATYHCGQCSAERTKEDREYKKLAKSGARRSFIPGQVLYVEKEDLTGRRIRKGENAPLERVTYLDRCNETRDFMSAKLGIPDTLRSVGNLYGHSVLLAEHGHGNAFAQETVDGGKHGAGGGVTPSMIEARQIAGIAQHCMKSLPIIRHRTNSRKYKMGPHNNLSARGLIDPVCVYGYQLREVAMRYGWWVENKETKLQKVPKQQSQKLKAALVDALEAIDEAFQEFGIDAQRIGVVKVR